MRLKVTSNDIFNLIVIGGTIAMLYLIIKGGL